VSTLADEEPNVRNRAAKSLKVIDPDWMKCEAASRAVPALASALKNENWGVRQDAAIALGRIADGRALEPLLTALKDRDWQVRQQSARALGKIGDAREILTVGHLPNCWLGYRGYKHIERIP